MGPDKVQGQAPMMGMIVWTSSAFWPAITLKVYISDEECEEVTLKLGNHPELCWFVLFARPSRS